jgi:peptidoglycan/xylan/chitin deacetylase (PgdA/CDA1 family)
MLRRLKLTALSASRALGLFHLAGNSRARARQLLILCYHGISIDDEHEWAPGLYMSQAQFAERIALLRQGGYAVLPLDDAVRRLRDGTLPPRSVAITFDDGNFDFYSRAWPVLKAAGMPATVYLTTYYCENSLPIFPLAISYLLWKARGRVASLRLSPHVETVIDARSAEARRRTHDLLVLHAQDMAMSAAEKDQLAAALAEALELDYADIVRRRLLRIMNPSEVRELAGAGVDFQMHTHRHRSPLTRAEYLAEIADNRRRISAYAGRTPSHFCYPSGVAMPEFARWLDEEGVRSATTCEPGMATSRSRHLQLPRLLDHSEMTDVEFEAWLSGIGALLPHRPVGFQPVDREGRLIIKRTPDAGTHTIVPEGGASRAVRV